MMLKAEERFTTKETTQAMITDTVDDVFYIVTSTMGPDGKVVVIQEGTAVTATKDGATVARALEFENKHQDKICQIISQAAAKTELECGDGTTTTIYLTKYLYDLFLKYPGYINRVKIEQFINQVIANLRKDSITVKKGDVALRQVAMITANRDESIVDTILQCFTDYDNPMIDLKEGNQLADIVAKEKGLRIRMAVSDPAFTKDKNGSSSDYVGLRYVVVNNNFTDSSCNPPEIYTALSKLSDRYPGETIGLVVNQASNTLTNIVLETNNHLKQTRAEKGTQFVVFSTNQGGSMGGLVMGDIASVLNAPMVNSVKDIEYVDLNVSKEVVSSTLLISLVLNVGEETQKRIDRRVEDVKATLATMNSTARYSPSGIMTERRLQELLGQVVTVYVGGETSADIQERKARFDDVALAVRSALAHGILPGCGVALRDAAAEIMASGGFEANQLNIDLVNVCFNQFNYLTKSEANGFMFTQTLKTLNEQWAVKEITNLATGEKGTPIELGVYDTAYASITALKGAMATAKILANTSAIVLTNRMGSIQY